MAPSQSCSTCDSHGIERIRSVKIVGVHRFKDLSISYGVNISDITCYSMIDNREWVIAIEAVSSTGWALPLCIVFKAKKYTRLGWFEDLSDG
ncbi:hypothetical protein TSTA_035100 [Talaromyces stipitatus ATCC 10500]|uniref:Uncharacterized protein n=1 Tax=Talaromyces stipitatus (strain ATCC 10500 / CBS 375.48 / QM 6759 / NRRL 1006) TaxID=441959 RepID=B8M761_TALSN|nr:uncharacterized protein TSTA_035100 [Talaromyces stipitatus ATCC 10500]EED20281.1 hypothetical protein TSTA_035100 [Talaromyces stipitatus ATCC 10500]